MFAVFYTIIVYSVLLCSITVYHPILHCLIASGPMSTPWFFLEPSGAGGRQELVVDNVRLEWIVEPYCLESHGT